MGNPKQLLFEAQSRYLSLERSVAVRVCPCAAPSRDFTALLFVLILGGMFHLLSSCSTTGDRANDHAEATQNVIAKGVIEFDARNLLSPKPFALLGPANVAQTKIVLAAHPCEGAAGSLLPPLALTQCSSGAVLGPLWALNDTVNGSSGRTLALRGLEHYHVYQGPDNNLCWAAALETARQYLNLRHISHTAMTAIIAPECPVLANQTNGAEIFQIAYAIAKFNHEYDRDQLNPRWCVAEKCIVDAIARGRPVIALKSEHAILIQGIEVAAGSADMIIKYYILDPGKESAQIETRTSLEMCTSDAFIAL